MLLIFPQMTDIDMYRLVREVYSEACIENAAEKHPKQSDLTEAIKEEEDYFVGFLKNFFAKTENTYYVLEEGGHWVSAFRLTEIEDFYYMEALETAPEHRWKGYASALITEVLSSLSQNGSVKIRSNVNKQNVASLATHRKCGFVIEEENGINYLCGEKYDHLYGMVYWTKKGEDETITRIIRMEELCDELIDVIQNSPDRIKIDPVLQEKVQILKDYYDNGQWLRDYECDERGELPTELKRGVLAQDTLYDLFSMMEN